MSSHKNFVHNDNIWRTHCDGENLSSKTWSSKWGFYSQEMHKLKTEQQKIASVRQTSYALSFDPSLKPRPDSQDEKRLKLPPIHNAAPKLSKSRSFLATSSGAGMDAASPASPPSGRLAMSTTTAATTHAAARTLQPAPRSHPSSPLSQSLPSTLSHDLVHTQEHNHGQQGGRSPLALTSRAFGSRAAEPLERYGPYCRGKCTAEKALGWPRF